MQTKRDFQLQDLGEEVRQSLRSVVMGEIEVATHLDGQYLLTHIALAEAISLQPASVFQRCRGCRGRLSRLVSPVASDDELALIMGRKVDGSSYTYKVYVCPKYGESHLWSKYRNYCWY